MSLRESSNILEEGGIRCRRRGWNDEIEFSKKYLYIGVAFLRGFFFFRFLLRRIVVWFDVLYV